MSAGTVIGLPEFLDRTRIELARQAACDACSLADLIAVQLEGTDEIASKAMAIRVSQLLSMVLWALGDQAADIGDMHFQIYNTRMSAEQDGATQ